MVFRGSVCRPTEQYETDDIRPSVDTAEVGKAMDRKGGHFVGLTEITLEINLIHSVVSS
jgi:hypothetical protein